MPLPQRTWLHHDIPSWVHRRDEVFFVTLCAAQRGTRHLIDPAIAPELLASIEHRHAKLEWWAHVVLIMPDHLHGLFSFPADGSGMKATVAHWKRWTSRTLGVEWQTGFFDHRLRTSESFEEKAHYIRMNPVRAGLVTDPAAWPHVWTPR